jgi:hypothetical protein
MQIFKFLKPSPSRRLKPIEANKHPVAFSTPRGFVIATKIHGTDQFSLAAQSLCLLQKAYDSRLNYDIIALRTDPLNDDEVGRLRQLVFLSNLTDIKSSDGKASPRRCTRCVTVRSGGACDAKNGKLKPSAEKD